MTGPSSYDLPKDRYYHPQTHMWVRPTEDETVRVGMDEIELDNLGELAYIDLKPIGTVISAGDSIGTFEAAKMTAEIFAPVSGTILSLNDTTIERPLTVNASPYADGWLIDIAPSDWDVESAGLVSGDAIGPWSVAEAQRFQDEYDATQ